MGFDAARRNISDKSCFCKGLEIFLDPAAGMGQNGTSVQMSNTRSISGEARTGTRSQRRNDARRMEILQAAGRIFRQRGFAEAGMREIAASADISPKQHVDVQAAAQKWIDSSISKTANVASDYPFEQFKDIYLYACEKQLKGCTTFRFNPERFQGVMVTTDDLKDTTYRFSLASGKVVDVRGDEMVEYEGEIHNAANLYDALKEGYYGKL